MRNEAGENVVLRARECRFSHNGRPVLDGVSLEVSPGERVALIGPNGAGKTTLVNLLTGVWTPSAGTVEVMGRPVRGIPPRELARTVAVVPQQSSFFFPYTVEDVVRMGRTPHLGFGGFESPEDLRAAEEAMRATDVLELRDRLVSKLSGGERQRAILARALAQEPSVLLLDEPTQSLDLAHAAGVFRILSRLRRERTLTILLVTHDLNLAARFADRILLMSEGRIVREGRPEEVLVPEVLSELFGVGVDVMRSPDGALQVTPKE